MRSRYDLAQDTVFKTDKGETYKDIFTIPIQKFTHTDSSDIYSLQTPDILRIDVMMNKRYGISEFDDFILWLNSIGLIQNKVPGEELSLPSSSDLENFYYKYRV